MGRTVRIFILQPQNATRHRECCNCGYVFKLGDKVVAKIMSRGAKTRYYCLRCAHKKVII